MNYDNHLLTYTPIAINLGSYSSGTLLALYVDTFSVIGNGVDSNFKTICQTYANSQPYLNECTALVYVSNSSAYVIGSTTIDFIKVTNKYSDETQIISKRPNNWDFNTSINTFVNSYDYLDFNTLGYYEGYLTYDNFNVYLDSNECCYFDYSNEYVPSDSNYLNYLVTHVYNGNDEYSFYYSVLDLDNDKPFTFEVGRPYQNMGDVMYNNGYGNGYTRGYTTGYNDGQNSNISAEPATAFNYIGRAFSTISDIMSLEIMPHITLGICFSIPFVIVMITTIFKLVKK